MFLFSASPTRGRIPLLGGDVVPGSDLSDYRVTVRQSNGKCELSLDTRVQSLDATNPQSGSHVSEFARE